uniref:Uncharacterized protein n=1 Tax=Cannabis sativa TaxID=3483 RepID=A0A803P2Y5_CANSA
MSFLAIMATSSKRKKPKSTKRSKATITEASSPIRVLHKGNEKVVEIKDNPPTSVIVASLEKIDVAELSTQTLGESKLAASLHTQGIVLLATGRPYCFQGKKQTIGEVGVFQTSTCHCSEGLQRYLQGLLVLRLCYGQ